LLEEETSEELINTSDSLDLAVTGETLSYNGGIYEIVTVAGDDKSGNRKSNVGVDIGYGDREYWGTYK
jgi:hypothetical protein